MLLPSKPMATDLPSIIGSGMVLQRERSVPLWGWDAPGTRVRVAFRGVEVETITAADGRWETAMPTGAAGGPFSLRIRGGTTHTLDDVLVGEVWIAGGQSNMWWQLKNCSDAAEAIASADLPQLRWYDANTSERQDGWSAEQPERSVAARWKTSHPSVAQDFAGTAHAFARRLQASLGVPVGIVHLAVPGSAIEQWLSEPLLRSRFPAVMTRNAVMVPDDTHGESALRVDSDPPIVCSGLYNGMVAPCAPFAARGFIWWQGEANAARFAEYRTLFPALIGEWRKGFRIPDAPFLLVELAGFGTRATSAVEDAPWPSLRDAQRAALRLPGTRMVCTLDILADYSWEIHPPAKSLAGERLHRAAMAVAYGASEEWSGPQASGFRFRGAQAQVEFTHAEGLRARDGGPLEGFALAGSDRIWHAAEAQIDGSTIVATAAAVPKPVALRYAWRNNPRECNLGNRAGLPACAFRSDDWPLGGDASVTA